MTDLSEMDSWATEVERKAREVVSAELREQRNRVMLLREALALALGVIGTSTHSHGTSARPVHDLIIVRAIYEDTAPPPAEPPAEPPAVPLEEEEGT